MPFRDTETATGEFFEDIDLASRNELAEFLASVERRAYKQARFAVRDEQAALDVVQDSMLKLSEKYGVKPPAELPMLFQRILQNTIRDYYRRHKVRATWVTQLSSILPGRPGEDEVDPLETLAPAEGSNQALGPPDHLEKSQLIVLIEDELKKLPPRQREAFLLRYWEELDVAESAQAMGCSEGSVKTHCSRGAYLGHRAQAQGDYTMNEREFGYQIKQQLDRSLDLDAATLERLRFARGQALARQRVTEPAFALAWVDAVAGRLWGSPAAAGIAAAGAALILLLVGVQYYWQQSPTVEEIADIDAALLSSDLPINAYLDKSFDTWLKRSQP